MVRSVELTIGDGDGVMLRIEVLHHGVGLESALLNDVDDHGLSGLEVLKNDFVLAHEVVPFLYSYSMAPALGACQRSGGTLRLS